MADESGQIIGAAAQTLGNYAVAAASNKRQYKNQVKAMALQQQYNKELWDYQNAYNTPQAQMERLKAAGLNPHLIYGSGSAGAGNAGAIAPTEVPVRQATRAEIPDLAMRRLIVRQMDAQYAATRQNIEAVKARTALTDVEMALKNLKVMQESARSKNYKDLAQLEIDTKGYAKLRMAELFQNERTKGNVMDQLMDVRQKQMTSMDLDNEFKRNRNELAKLGIYQSDDIKWRVLIQAANRMGIDIGALLAQGAAKLKYLFE